MTKILSHAYFSCCERKLESVRKEVQKKKKKKMKAWDWPETTWRQPMGGNRGTSQQ